MTKLTKHVRHAAHKAGTARAHRKVTRMHKRAKFDDMLNPQFTASARTTRQEIIAGIVTGVLLLIFLGFSIIVGFPSLGGLIGGGDTASHTVTKPKSIVAQQAALQVKLRAWHNSAGGQAYKAYPNFHYVVLNVEIRHKYAVPTWLAPSLQSYVVDQNGQQYVLTPDDEFTDPLASKQYLPGETARGSLAYEVPDSAKQLQWCYDLARGTSNPNPLCIPL